MKKYQFKNIESIFVTGDCHGEFKSFFNEIKKSVKINKEDEEETHPMEIERQARKKAKEEAAIAMQANRQGRVGIGGYRRYQRNPFDGPDTFDDAIRLEMDMSKSFHKNYVPFSPYSNSIIFVAGDCGFGFNKEKYYTDLLEKYNKIMSYNNITIIFVRGNHDDPQYFDGEKINLSNIKAVPDYAIVETKDKNILCVGGAISTDRVWRIEQEKRINRFKPTNSKRLYWENEAPVLDKEKMDEIFKEYDRIDYVISHTAPSFAIPSEHAGLSEWEGKDKDLRADVRNERLTMDRIFEYLRDNNRKPLYWAYGHFDMSFIEKRSETWFRALQDGFNPYSITMDINTAMGEASPKKVKKKGKVNKKAITYADLAEGPRPINHLNNLWQEQEMIAEEQGADAIIEVGEEVGEPADEQIADEGFPVNEVIEDREEIANDAETQGMAVDFTPNRVVNVTVNRNDNGIYTIDYAPVYTTFANTDAIHQALGQDTLEVQERRRREFNEAIRAMQERMNNATATVTTHERLTNAAELVNTGIGAARIADE